ncbi:hypothetical protein HPB51_001418 [Rhipicephalus microplus]|uniref:Uncharacterized protein n=1 Tax=Rhipicephalus microplus TaxID=6941 RepID=A0A9J6EFD3_RHIMP|nr:hypothetical protein HPB51_001418 [Rhipicephalus microplus]
MKCHIIGKRYLVSEANLVAQHRARPSVLFLYVRLDRAGSQLCVIELGRAFDAVGGPGSGLGSERRLVHSATVYTQLIRLRCILCAGYKHWHADLRMEDTPLEAGLGFTCKLKSDVDFLGRTALERQKADGLRKRIACFTVDE